MDWALLLKEYGLPVFMLVGFGFLITKGYLVPGITHQDVIKQRDRALDLVYEIAQGLKPIAAVIVERPPNRRGEGRGQDGME